MKSRSLRNTLLAGLLLALLAFAACGRRPAPTVPAPIATTQPTAEPTAPPATSPPTPTATPAPANTALPSPTATAAPTASPPPTTTVAPTPAPTVTPTPAPNAVVASETLNMRSGPDTQFEPVARLARGDALTVLGQSGRCNWLKVLTVQGVMGWVARLAGGVELVTLNLSCEKIAALSVPPPTARPLPPTQPPSPTAQPLPPTQPPPAEPQPQPTSPPPPPPPPPQPVPRQPPPPPPSQPTLPEDRGCYLFQNSMGAELTVTLSGPGGWSDNFTIPANSEHLSCLVPGTHNYTIHAPPPWADINGSLDVQAGQDFLFSMQGRP